MAATSHHKPRRRYQPLVFVESAHNKLSFKMIKVSFQYRRNSPVIGGSVFLNWSWTKNYVHNWNITGCNSKKKVMNKKKTTCLKNWWSELFRVERSANVLICALWCVLIGWRPPVSSYSTYHQMCSKLVAISRLYHFFVSFKPIPPVALQVEEVHKVRFGRCRTLVLANS